MRSSIGERVRCASARSDASLSGTTRASLVARRDRPARRRRSPCPRDRGADERHLSPSSAHHDAPAIEHLEVRDERIERALLVPFRRRDAFESEGLDPAVPLRERDVADVNRRGPDVGEVWQLQVEPGARVHHSKRPDLFGVWTARSEAVRGAARTALVKRRRQAPPPSPRRKRPTPLRSGGRAPRS